MKPIQYVFLSLSAILLLWFVLYKTKSSREYDSWTNVLVRSQWITELATACPAQGYSQGDQDCRLDKIFNNIGTTNKYYVEYGFNSLHQCDFTGPNTCKLWKVHKWEGLLLTAEYENPEINLHKHFLYSNNIVSIFEKYNVPKVFDYLSSDMDSHDIFVLEALLKAGYKPRVVSTEYNSNFPIGMDLCLGDPELLGKKESERKFTDSECIWGASAGALKELMERYGYALITVSTRLDLFWVRRDALPGITIPSFEYFYPQIHVPRLTHYAQNDWSRIPELVDWNTYAATGDIHRAQEVAMDTVKDNVRSGSTLPCFSKLK
jgi:hypothetical protein